jgi:hypothetical protein
MNNGTRLPSLANGAPAQPLRPLVWHPHDLRARTLCAALEEIFKGAIALPLLALLERFATTTRAS